MRRRFARAAADPAGFERATALDREISARMAERLDYVKLAPAVVVDAGCGSGRALPRLAARFPEARIVAVDADAAQLRQARKATLPGALGRWLGRLAGTTRLHPVRADFTRLPLAGASVGCLWSNLALHWIDDPSMAFVEWHRVLATEGLVLFSTFGPDTLKELRAAWASADGDGPRPEGKPPLQRVHSFFDMHDLGDMLVHAGFADPVMDMETITLTYRDLDALLAELRGAGAAGSLNGRARGLTGRASWRRMRAAYEARRVDGTLPATFEIVYGHAWKPQPRAKPGADGIARVRIEDIGRRG